MKAQIIAIALLCGLASSCTQQSQPSSATQQTPSPKLDTKGLQAENDELKKEITAIRVAMSTAAYYLNEQAGREEMQISVRGERTEIMLNLDQQVMVFVISHDDSEPSGLLVHELIYKPSHRSNEYIEKVLGSAYHPEWATLKDWQR